jgi:arylsulfatase A-like enzyme
VLTERGYQTRGQGKMHFTPARTHYGFEQMEITPDYLQWMRRRGRVVCADGAGGAGANEMEPVAARCEPTETLTRWTVDRSIDFLESRDPDRPFFLWTSFFHPHPPFEVHRDYLDLYRDVTLPEMVRGDWSAEWEKIPPTLRRPTVHLSGAHRFSRQQWLASRRAYYACITEIDYTLGLLFGRLHELGLLENTWILFTSDHGVMLGDYGLAAKAQPLESAARIPLIVRPPHGRDDWDALRGGVCNELVCLADVMPTCLAIAGGREHEETPDFDGGDLLRGARGERLRDRLFFEVRDCHAVVDAQWKYIFCRSDGAELLFNLADDPAETRNLIDQAPAQADAYRRLLADQIQPRHPDAVKEGRPVATGPAVDLRHFSSHRHPGLMTGATGTYYH